MDAGEIKELKEEVSNLKLALERKEAELEQWRAGHARNIVESQKQRAVSPFRLPKLGVNASMKSETSQRPTDDKIYEARSCSSGKQRRSRFPSSFMDKESTPRMPHLPEEKIANSAKGRSPSPPIRRSISTDRGSVIKSKVKIDMVDNQPIVKHPFPARVPVNKSLSPMPMAPCTDNNSRINGSSHEATKQENISETLFNLQKVTSRKVHHEQEEEQFKQALTAVRQGGIRKSKAEGKAKVKHQHQQHQQLPFRIQKSDFIPALIPEMDIADEKTLEAARKSDYSEPENDLGLIESPVHGALNLRKIRQNFPRNSQNLEPRRTMQAGEPLLASRVENKLVNGSSRNLREGSNTPMPELRRSRSTPRGKFLLS